MGVNMTYDPIQLTESLATELSAMMEHHVDDPDRW